MGHGFYLFYLTPHFTLVYFESNVGLKNALRKWPNTGNRAKVRSAIEFHIQRCVDTHFNTDNDNDNDKDKDNDSESDKVTLICWIFRISKMQHMELYGVSAGRVRRDGMTKKSFLSKRSQVINFLRHFS